CLTPVSLAQDTEKKVTAVHIQSPIVIDGNLDEPEWSLAQPATGFIQQEPLMGEPSTELTEVRFLYDDENLYLGVYCFDSAGPEGITVTDISRDYVPRESDTFTMVFDTFNDKRNGFIFGTNPGGAKRDGQTAGDSERRNYDWDTVWHVKTKITEQGWQAEIAIPFQALRFRDVEEQVWGVNFSRRIRRKNEYIHWSPVPRPYRTSRTSLAGELNGLSGIRQGRNLYFKPYLLAPVVRRAGDDVDFIPDVGFDVKYGVTSESALDVTVNTDFSQVEADRQQINLTRFPLFFPEKREFFLENASLFQVRRVGRGFRNSSRDLIAFFTRRIGLSQGRVVPILGGARFTGRVGPYGLGFLSIQSSDFEELPSTNFTVARVQRDILRNSDVGGIFINKQGGGQYNRTYGVDSHLQFFQHLEIASFFLKTDTPGLLGEDTSTSAFVGWADPRYDIQAEYLSIEDNFNPEVGFVPRKGIRKSRGEFNLKLRPGEGIPWMREFRPSTGIEYITNQANLVQSKNFDQTLEVELQNGGLFQFTHRVEFERLDEPFFIQPDQAIPVGDYVFGSISTHFSTDRSRMFSGNIDLRVGEFFDGHQDSYEAGLRFQLGARFATDVSWEHDDVDLPSGAFSTDLVNTSIDYSFSPRMFLNALIQYNSTLDEISSNIRFNFIYKPLSDFFLVYNERRAAGGEVIERALIAKLTYLLDF
ncbi:MAG: carbohydrate binding family 9 domain-containing protein, partial [Acidobacteria bacterium]|nr:carbohydrate binding family 9 domain-containing protein [Acidobacteriota bacterium]